MQDKAGGPTGKN